MMEGEFVKKNMPYILLLFLLAIMLISLIFIFVSCDTTPLSDNELIEQIEIKFLEHFDNYHLEYTEIAIYERLISDDKKSEFASAKLHAYNDTMTYDCKFEAFFVLDDKKWSLQDYKIVDGKYKVYASTVTVDDAESILLENISFNEEYHFFSHIPSFDAERDEYIYRISYNEGYIEALDEFKVTFSFTPDNGWRFENANRTNLMNEWNVLGKWSYANSKSNMELTIHQLSDREITFQYDFDYWIPYESMFTGYNYKHLAYKSDGTETRNIEYQGEMMEFPLLNNDISSPKVYIDKYGGLMFDGTYVNPDNTFVFSYDDGGGYSIPTENSYWPKVIALSDTPLIGHAENRIHFGDMGTDYTDINNEKHHDCYIYTATRSGDRAARLVFDLYGQYSDLSGMVFLEEHASYGRSAKFRVYGDGELLYEYDAENFSQDHYREKFIVSVDNVRELAIELTGEYSRQSSWLGSIERPIIVPCGLTLTK